MNNSHPSKPLMSNKAFDTLKYMVQYVLPAAGALYFTLSQIWGLPHAEEVVGTIAALTLFIGVVMGFSTAQYNKTSAAFDGALVLDNTTSETHDTYSLEVDMDLDELHKKDTLTLQIKKV